MTDEEHTVTKCISCKEEIEPDQTACQDCRNGQHWLEGWTGEKWQRLYKYYPTKRGVFIEYRNGEKMKFRIIFETTKEDVE